MKDSQLHHYLTRPDGLAARLKNARGGMLAKDLAAQAGWLPSKVSKIESGKQLPSEADLTTWAAITGISDAVLAQLQAMLVEAQAARSTYEERIRLGQKAVQRELNEIIRSVTSIRVFSMTFVPRYLQIADYTRAVLQYFYDLHGEASGVEDVDVATAERQAGNDVLYDNGRSFQFLIDEAALRRQGFPASIMRSQLDRLVSASGLRNVRLGIYPLKPATPTSPEARFVFPQNSFVLLDDIGEIETARGTLPRLLADDVEWYDGILDRMWESALVGNDARHLIQEVADSLPGDD